MAGKKLNVFVTPLTDIHLKFQITRGSSDELPTTEKGLNRYKFHKATMFYSEKGSFLTIIPNVLHHYM